MSSEIIYRKTETKTFK